MARFLNNRFYGIAPKVPPRALAEGYAQEAQDVDLALPVQVRPLHGNRFIQALGPATGGINALYLYENNHWFQFGDADTDVVKGPLAADDTKRVYITDSQFPQVTRNDLAIGGGQMPSATYRLGVPAPTSSPTATAAVGVGDPENPFFTAYVYTFVTQWGEEGPPSAPSAVVEALDGGRIEVEFSPPPTGGHDWKSVRLYRLNTGSNGSEFQFVSEVLLPTTTYTDEKSNDELAEVVPSVSWEPPPDENYPTGPLRGLTALPNGSLAGFTGPTLCISEPYLPHAWPVDNQYPIDRDIVAIGRVPYGLILLTDAMPYLASGTDPSAISLSPLPESQACMSKRSVVNMGGYVIYASPEGLAAVDGSNVKVLTENMFREEQWRSQFNPASIRAYYWEGRYVGFYDNGTTQAGFIFNPSSDEAAFVPISLYATAGFYDTASDQLYLNIEGDLSVFSHPDEPLLTYTWHSRNNRLAVPTPMSAVRLVGSGEVDVEVFADGVMITSDPLVIDGYSTLRLPPGYRAKEWSVRLVGTAFVEQVDLVTSVQELQG